MPWKVRAGGKDCPYEVVKADTGKRVACHPTRERALAQMRALYAHEPTVKSGNPYHDRRGRFTTGGGHAVSVEPDPTGANSGDAVQAWHGDKLVGNLTWAGKNSTKPGTKPTIQYVSVHPDYRRQGVATNMIDWVRQNVEPDLDFNDWLTRSGKGLAESMGYTPENWEEDPSDQDDSDWAPGGRFDRTRQDVAEEVRQQEEWSRRMARRGKKSAVGKATPMNVVTKSVEATLEPVDDEASPTGRFHAILSTEDLDRDGEELDADDWLLPLPERINIDTDHGRSVEKTVGSAVPTLKDRQLHVDGGFSSVPHAQLARTLVKEGHIDKMSVTYRVVKDAGGAPKRELLSGAFVALPANPNAVVLSAKSAKAMDGKQLDASGNNPDHDHDEDGKSHAQTMHDVAVGLGAQCAANRTQADTGEDEGANKTFHVVIDDEARTATIETKTSSLAAGSLQESAEESAAADTTAVKAAVSAAADESADDVAKQAALLHARSLAFLIQKNCQ